MIGERACANVLRMRNSILLITTFIAFGTASAQPLANFIADHRIPQEDLRAGISEYLLAQVPALVAPTSPSAWDAQAAQLRQRFKDKLYLRGVPQAWRDHEVRVEWTEDIDTGHGYRIRKLRYEALPGLWIPALMYEPNAMNGKVPVVLSVNGHARDTGKTTPHAQLRNINIAKRGMIALHPEWFACGEFQDAAYDHGNIGYLDLVGVGGISLFYYALERALDVLLEHPNADTERVAMTGLSGGGWQTAIYSAMDERIDVIVPNAGHSGMANRITSLRDMGDLEQVPVDLLTIGDYSHITALFAPRPSLLIYNAKDQCCFLPETALPSLRDPVLPVYELFGKADDFRYHINEDPGTHNYDLDNRQQLYRFIEEFFLPASERRPNEIPSGDEVLDFEALRVGFPQDNATFASLALEQFASKRRPVYDTIAETSNAIREAVRWPEITFEVTERAMENVGRYRTTALHIGTQFGPVFGLLIEGGADTPRSALYVSDAPIQDRLEAIEAIASEHGTVLALEPSFLGGNQPVERNAWQLSMALEATGNRTLGVQASQIASALRWLQRERRSSERHVYSSGEVAGVASMIALAVDADCARSLNAEGALESLANLIREGRSWSELQSLFCFGLLEVIDLPEIKDLFFDMGIQLND